MGRPPMFPAEVKTRIVLSILAGELSVAQAARQEKVSEQSIGRWKAEFLEGGRTALLAGRSGPSLPGFQARQRAERPRRGPWPRPRRVAYRDAVIAIAERYPAWGQRKVSALARHSGYAVTASTVLRILDDAGLVLKADYQRQRRDLAKTRKAALMVEIGRAHV